MNLAEELPKEQKRVRELAQRYAVMPTGVFALALMNAALEEAEVAAASGNISGMLAALDKLKEFEYKERT